MEAILETFSSLKGSQAKPALELLVSASYWLGVPTSKSQANFDKYPTLGDQYQTLIQNLVDRLTKEGAVVII